jgi:hypothetical protein
MVEIECHLPNLATYDVITGGNLLLVEPDYMDLRSYSRPSAISAG